jgi:sugar lactone lactonase YvrE
MRTPILERAWRAFGQAHLIPQSRGVIVMAALLLAAASLSAAPTVGTTSGGPRTGYPSGAGHVGGDIASGAEYHTPCGLAMDSSGNYLFVADRDNNAVRLLQFDVNWTYDIVGEDENGNAITNLFNKPVGIALDNAENFLFVLNRGKGTDGNVLEFDLIFGTIATNLAKITNAGGITVDTLDNIYVTASNKVIKVTSSGVSNVVATVTAPGASLQGIAFKQNGLLAVCDAGRNGILLINPNTGVITTNAGFHGKGDFFNANNVDPSNTARFFQPTGVAETGDGTLIVSDYGNHRVKRVLATGAVTNLYGVTSNDWVGPYKGHTDGTVVVPDKLGGVSARQPNGVALAPDGTVYVTEDYYHIIRHVTGAGLQPPPPPPPAAPTGLTATTNSSGVLLTWAASVNATNYNVERAMSSGGPYTIIGMTTTTSFTDTNVLAGTTYYYVVTASNSGGVSGNSTEVSVTISIPPPPSPEIGWYDFEGNTMTGFYSVLHPVSGGNPYIANNPLLIAINSTTNGPSIHYITIPPSTNGAVPSASYGSTPPTYEDGQQQGSPNVNPLPSLALSNGLVTIEAVNFNGVGESSAVASAEFLFQVGTPMITGNNAAQFTLTDVTTNAVFYYTLDGTDPTNAPASQQIFSTNGTVTLSLNGSTNIFFQVRAFGYGPTAGYAVSGIAQQSFTPGSFVPNTISFGFASGEASSAFVGAAGQTFYAPVTLTMLPSTPVYSLQFNISVSSTGMGVTNPAPAPGPFNFQSMLKMPGTESNVPGTVYYTIPPWMFAAYETASVPPSDLVTNAGQVFVSLLVSNGNQLAVGWLERYGRTNLYPTTSQTLISYSMAHDDLFPNASLGEPNGVIVGGYSFQISPGATNGQQYQIQVGQASATDDGIGAVGSAVIIFAPTATNSASLGVGSLNAIKNITVGSIPYLVGDVYPFRWFNAGDFGSSNLITYGSEDAEQVFQAAVYNWNYPLFDPSSANGSGGYTNVSDFYDAMDSAGGLGYVDSDPASPFYGYYTNAGPLTAAQEVTLLSGNSTAINQMAFGDGKLDVADVYVTFLRSEFTNNLLWFQRLWTNGVRVATANYAPGIIPALPASSIIAAGNSSTALISITNTPTVNFTAGDYQATAGQRISIPVTASVFGPYPLRVLMLNISVVPLDGSPALTQPISLTLYPPFNNLNDYNPAASGLQSSSGNGNYSVALLPIRFPIPQTLGVSNNAIIGYLTVTIPANATSLSAYAVHFDHASASPNGLASFPKQTLTGVITLSSRTNSTYNDGIPDSWRLRWFGTVNNLLSVSNACPSGDGMDNWQKYVAGVDPNAPNDFPRLNPATPVPAGANAAIHWPTVNGKQYVILRSSSLFPGSWSAIATNTGTGTDMEFDDTTASQTRFYRVQILP